MGNMTPNSSCEPSRPLAFSGHKLDNRTVNFLSRHAYAVSHLSIHRDSPLCTDPIRLVRRISHGDPIALTVTLPSTLRLQSHFLFLSVN